MAELTIQKLTTTGVVVTYASAAASGDFFTLEKDTGYEFRFLNGSGGTLTATVAGVQLDNQGAALLDNVISCDAGEEKAAKIQFYSIDPDSNRVDVTYSGVSSVTVAIVEVP